MALTIKNSCEIEDLIESIKDISGHSYSEVESILVKYHIYPENKKTFLTKKFGSIVCDIEYFPEDQWLEESLQLIFKEANINDVYVTEAI